MSSVATAGVVEATGPVSRRARDALRLPRPVAESWRLAHLTPRRLPWRRLALHGIESSRRRRPQRRHRSPGQRAGTRFAIHGPHR